MRKFERCPRCGALLVKSIAFNGADSEYWMECTRCNTYVNTFVPQAHQDAILADAHTYVLSAGGYGSGKTLTDRQQVYKHCFITPNAAVLIGANVISQYEATIQRDIFADIPKAFVKKWSAQKATLELINGARILFRPFDDVDKLRSYNLSMFVIMEGSECSPEVFVQLKTRLRNLVASKPVLDDKGEPVFKRQPNGAVVPEVECEWLKGIVETNPDSGWVRSEMLFHSHEIHKHGDVADVYQVLDQDKDPNISTHITATSCNAYLPPNFIDQLVANKPKFWIDRYLHGSFLYSEGLVHPQWASTIVPHKEVDYLDNTIKFVCGADYGLSDDFVYVYAYVDQRRGKVVVYDCHVLNNKSVDALAKAFLGDTEKIPVGGWFCQPVLDSKSGKKRDYLKKDLYSHFMDYGVNFGEAQMDINSRVYRTNTYIELGYLEIMDNCTYLIDELREYKFVERKVGETYKKTWDKPKDGNDHAIAALHFLLMELPADPHKLVLGSYDSEGNSLEEWKRRTELYDSNNVWMPWQLRDNDTEVERYEAQWTDSV